NARVGGGDVLDRRLGGRVPEDVVVGLEPGCGGAVHPQIVLAGRQPVLHRDAIEHLASGGVALERETVLEVVVGHVADVDGAGGGPVVEAMVAVVPRDVPLRHVAAGS